MSAQFDPSMFLAILPEMGLILLAALTLVLDLIWRDRRCRFLGWITAGGLAVVAGLSVAFARPGPEPLLIFGGMLRLDDTGFVFRMIFLFGATLTSLFAVDNEGLCRKGEFYTLMLVSTLGMSLMATAADLILLFLAIETTSIPLYVLAGFILRDEKSVEAGIKYLLFGAMTSAITLYGFSLLYGFSGTTQIFEMGQIFSSGQISPVLIGMSILLVIVGFAFKISAVPFHFWAPDVYQGAPTPVAGFLSTASKAAGFAVLMRVLLAVFPGQTNAWTLLVAIMATASMFVGNFLALAQKNIKRLLAYSSIAQAGYILIGVASGSKFGITGSIYYLLGYLFTNLVAFGVVSVVEDAVESSEISAFSGLSRRNPLLALVMLAALLSLGGIPPFAGFFGKLLVFGSAIETGQVWLAIVGIINSIVALYYYLTVLRVIYQGEGGAPYWVSPSWNAALVIGLIGILVLGVVFSPFFNWALQASQSLSLFY
ncbi:NADH dehydrogenase subunit N [Longilinea arvoryzae]|uniref:NADH-quinone oxidoreductase subunit N n=1 Tax=Longilinea arvoryzae TaxID=360412 RepID=A0A0S7BMN0_9CHLR|nr:NADH-quinone oxidoreductase subunit N [Longilinea arvoryzae]GAP15275.1 NADH dehydrogenase subunit N [Longilinea arvoryzae]